MLLTPITIGLVFRSQYPGTQQLLTEKAYGRTRLHLTELLGKRHK